MLSLAVMVLLSASPPIPPALDPAELLMDTFEKFDRAIAHDLEALSGDIRKLRALARQFRAEKDERNAQKLEQVITKLQEVQATYRKILKMPDPPLPDSGADALLQVSKSLLRLRR
jgi:hypothetical protein